MAHLQYMPGDQRLVDQLVYELKSKGIFDQFRKDCIADVDTRPAYQNLRQRVESSVTTFLSRQKWRPDLNKNQLREKLRKHILDGNYLDQGVERIVDQVVNPKVASVFIPQVEDLVYNYLGIKINKTAPTAETSNGKHEDLLPTDLEAVSPGSVKSNDDKVDMDICSTDNTGESKMEIDEDSKPKPEIKDESSQDKDESQLSGISDLTSHSSDSIDIHIPLPADIKPESIPPPDTSPPKIALDQIKPPKVSDIPLPDAPMPQEMSELADKSYFKPVELCSEDDSSSNSSDLRRNMSPLTPVRNFDDENSCDAQQGFDDVIQDKNDQRKASISSFSFNMELKSDDSADVKTEKKELAYQFESQVVIKTPVYEESSNSNNLQIDYESDANSKTNQDSKPEPDQSSQDVKKDRSDDRRSHKSSHRSRDSHRPSSSSKDRRSESKHSSSRDKRDEKKSRDDHSKKSSHRERSRDDDKSRDSSKQRQSSHKSSSKDSKSHRSSSSSWRPSSKHSDDKKSSSSNRDRSGKSSSRDHKSSRDTKSSSHRSDSDRKSSSSRSKTDKDKDKKDKKDTDDHYSLSGRGNNSRRSTDRDSNDGNSSSSKGSNNQTASKTAENKKDKGESSKSGSSTSSGTSPSDKDNVASDKVTTTEVTQSKPIRVDHLEMPMTNSSPARFMPEVVLKKPKFASNLEEARKMMKMRKFLDEEQRRMNQEAALLLEFQANVRPSLSQVYSNISGPELEFACVNNVEANDDEVAEDIVEETVEEVPLDDEFVEIDPETIQIQQEYVSNDLVDYESGNVVTTASTELFEVTVESDDGDSMSDLEAEVAEMHNYINQQKINDIIGVPKPVDEKQDLQFFTQQERYNAELYRDQYTEFFNTFTKELTRKLFLVNCDSYSENVFKDVSQTLGDYAVVTYRASNGLKLPKATKNIEFSNEEISLPIDKTAEVKSPLNSVPQSPFMSPIKSECSFELSSDYDAKLEDMVNTTSRQQIMEIILGGVIGDGSPSKMPKIDICNESNIESMSRPNKRKYSEMDGNDNNNRQVLTQNKIRNTSCSDQITSTTEDTDDRTSNPRNNINTPRSKYLGKAKRVGLPKPKRSLHANSPSSDKSVENYEDNNTTPTLNGKIKTPRNKVQRYDTSDLYKPKLHFLSRRNNIT